MSDLFDRPIAFHRIFVTVSGSVAGAVFLSQAVYWSARCDETGWFYKTQAEWHEETGLSRCEQESARKKLVELGVLEEERRGLPAKMFYHVNRKQLNELLRALKAPQSSMRENSKLECGKTANWSAGKQQTSNSAETTTYTTVAVAPSGKLKHQETPIPKELDTAEFRTAWAQWLDDLKRRRVKLTDHAKGLHMAKLSKLGAVRGIEAIQYSIESSYRSIFEPKTFAPRNGQDRDYGTVTFTDGNTAFPEDWEQFLADPEYEKLVAKVMVCETWEQVSPGIKSQHAGWRTLQRHLKASK